MFGDRRKMSRFRQMPRSYWRLQLITSDGTSIILTLDQDEDEDQSVLKDKSLEPDKASATYSNQVSTVPMFQSFLSVGQPLP